MSRILLCHGQAEGRRHWIKDSCCHQNFVSCWYTQWEKLGCQKLTYLLCRDSVSNSGVKKFSFSYYPSFVALMCLRRRREWKSGLQNLNFKGWSFRVWTSRFQEGEEPSYHPIITVAKRFILKLASSAPLRTPAPNSVRIVRKKTRKNHSPKSRQTAAQT